VVGEQAVEIIQPVAAVWQPIWVEQLPNPNPTYTAIVGLVAQDRPEFVVPPGRAWRTR
jgi:hypothetical protein